MKNLIKTLGIGILSVFAFSNVNAQEAGDVGIGLRATTDGAGLNVNTFITDHFLFEGQVNAGGFDLKGRSITGVGLLKGAINLSNNDPVWKLYLGAGGHASLYDDEIEPFAENSDDGSVIVDEPEWRFGVDALVGVEYFMPNYPLGITIDVKPAVNIDREGDISFFPHNLVGVGLKYYIR